MNFFKRMTRRLWNNNESGRMSLADVNNFFGREMQQQYGPDISEITYFTCLKTLSEAMGKLPIYLVDADKNRVINHETTPFLSVSPNQLMTPAQMLTSMEYCRNHFGNAYLYPDRDPAGNLIGIYPLDPRCVTIWVDNTGILDGRPYMYQYVDPKSAKAYWFLPDDLIHVRSWITGNGGYAGKSVREILASYMQGNKSSQEFMNELYQHGLTANVIVKYVGDLSKANREKLVAQMTQLAGTKTDRVLPLPYNWDAVPLNLSLTDSQFFELKKFSALQVAAAFGIKPNHLNNYEKSSYANSSAQNLSFYVDTLLFNLTLYEQEFTRKLLTRAEQAKGLHYEFNVSVILRGDPEQQSKTLQTYVTSGIYTINEARRKAGLPPVPDGDVILINGSYVPLKDAGQAYQKGGETNET